ncbi:GAF domain-containing protein [Scytonema sp. UIC 10036]|uniref:GAF domain-containing protein n=1 Tax=Scytonema sp. UIC 10036 TaxID=2304196 RepID=UPI0012DA60E6|nr:GAF domain-containing protein [Scytonema sp. UIC 10036]MUG99359.1 GAF domain-containing protein [Scytonema sp. UIC 10036]
MDIRKGKTTIQKLLPLVLYDYQFPSLSLCPLRLRGSFKERAKEQGKPLIILDTLADQDFATNPAVFQPGVRFYAGIPLITSDGYSVGTLCMLDFTPRQLKHEQIAGLHALSRQVMSQLELRLALRKVTQTNLALTAVSCG